VINLIFNAIDAMPEGGKLIVGTSYNPSDRNLTIRVTDTGSGIDKNDLPRIFEPFFTTKSEGQGLGLGLSMVEGIVERHKGSIEITSEVGKGTTFTVKLPAKN
ncbi:MAG: GHKL domain-containing protein, partial [Deltaproteobacteria bacterium]|nr:GHKL domain-containing protein [Deltaproteobacteria bacterium]